MKRELIIISKIRPREKKKKMRTTELICCESIFCWDKDGSEESRDDERCGRVRDISASELIENIRNFLCEGHRASIMSISLQFGVGVAIVDRIIDEHAQNLCKIYSQVAK